MNPETEKVNVTIVRETEKAYLLDNGELENAWHLGPNARRGNINLHERKF
jgi:uncharacterized protein (UPF0303 family)